MTEVIGLTADSLLEKEKNDRIVMELELKKRAFETIVPTLPAEIQEALRSYNQPIRIFGEDASDTRQRLRVVLAYRSLLQDQPQQQYTKKEKLWDDESLKAKPATTTTTAAPASTTTTYTHASLSLIGARQSICNFSLQHAKKRLQTERYRRSLQQQQQQASTSLNPRESQLFQQATNLTLEASHYGDTRTLSALCTLYSLDTNNHDNSTTQSRYVLTASWNATLQLWNVPCIEDTNTRIIQLCSTKSMAHHDRIMGMSSYAASFHNISSSSADPSSANTLGFLATSSIDLTAKLWKILLPQQSHNTLDQQQQQQQQEEHHNPMQKQQDLIQELSTLRGHQQRLCKTCFHPNGTHVITTSFDTTWRLWDITRENDHELLLQDGHDRETYGIGMHPDGSIVSITDFAGIVRLWDLRSGKNILHFLGHAKRVLCSEFHPNGFQLTTAGDDGTIRVWDIRKRSSVAVIPAHSNLITQLRFYPSSESSSNGDILATSSFDGTCRLWSTRDWTMLHTLQGHEGKVTGVDFITYPTTSNAAKTPFSIVTCGFDKTLKLWT